MKPDAEKSGAAWAAKEDNRVTYVGRLLRRTRIDEIPQFLNVIKGQMSIVGPRPERPELEQSIQEELPYWKCRYLLKPGLTGWAQIRFKYASDMESSEEKLAYDLYYIKNASFFWIWKLFFPPCGLSLKAVDNESFSYGWCRLYWKSYSPIIIGGET